MTETAEINIRLRVDRKRYTIADMLQAEGGSLRAMVDLVARSMVDETGEYIDPDQARETLQALDGDSFADVFIRFSEELQALPKAKRGR